MENIKDIIYFVNQNWLIVLPFGVALIFLPRYTANLIFVITGFVVGAFGVFPSLMNFLQDKNEKIFEFLNQNPTVSMVVIGIITAGIFAILFKLAMFLIAGAVGFFIGKFAAEFFLRFFPNFNPDFEVFGLNIVYLSAIVVALIVGIYSLIKSEKMIKYLSITIGSFLTTLVIFTLLSSINLIPNYPENIETWTLAAMIVVFMVLFFIGSRVAKPDTAS